MKKQLLLAISAFAFAGLSAQNAPVQPTGPFVKVPAHIANQSVKISRNGFIKNEMGVLPVKSGNPYTNSVQTFEETCIGQTVYDLQTNSSVQNRVVNHGGGKVSAIWTFGKVDPGFPERGMAYQYRDTYGAAWVYPNNCDVDNITAVEFGTIRTGFGSLDRIANKGDVIIAHNVDGTLEMSSNNSVGDVNSWVSVATPLDSSFWPRMKVGGTNGQSIHVISLTTPTTGDPTGVPFMGIDGALVYSRSTNGGQTWDKQKVLLPGIDSTIYSGFGGDEYAIDTKGDIVAFVTGGFRHDIFLMKSTDNGDTWTKTVIDTFFMPNFEDQISDINGDDVADTLEVSDGAMAIVIDNNNKVHCFWGAMRILNDDSTDAQISYFPGTQGMVHWAEGQTAPDTVAFIMDRDGNGLLDIGDDIPVYQVGLTSHPSCGVDANNNIYVSYSSIADATLLDTRSYRHLFGCVLDANTNTWSAPVEYVPNVDDFTEYVYGAMAEMVDDSVRIVYQADGEPGIAVSPEADNPHPYAENDIRYLAIGTAFFTTSVKTVAADIEKVIVYPNPAAGTTQLNFNLKNAANVNASILNVMGQKVATINGGNMAPGNHMLTLNIEGLASGLYFVNLTTGTQTVSQKLIVK